MHLELLNKANSGYYKFKLINSLNIEIQSLHTTNYVAPCKAYSAHFEQSCTNKYKQTKAARLILVYPLDLRNLCNDFSFFFSAEVLLKWSRIYQCHTRANVHHPEPHGTESREA